MLAFIEMKVLSGEYTGKIYKLPEELLGPWYAGHDNSATPKIEPVKLAWHCDPFFALIGSVESPIIDIASRHHEYLGLGALDTHERDR